jgi:hypothetical protein
MSNACLEIAAKFKPGPSPELSEHLDSLLSLKVARLDAEEPELFELLEPYLEGPNLSYVTFSKSSSLYGSNPSLSSSTVSEPDPFPSKSLLF